MEIKNEEHAREMVREWRKLPLPAQKREVRLAIQNLELSCMYYEQKQNDQGVRRCTKSITVLQEHLETIEE